MSDGGGWRLLEENGEMLAGWHDCSSASFSRGGEGKQHKTISPASMDTLINWLNVNHQPAEQMCADSRLQTDVCRCVTQHLSRHSTAIPTSHFTHSWECRAGMRHEAVFDPNVPFDVEGE